MSSWAGRAGRSRRCARPWRWPGRPATISPAAWIDAERQVLQGRRALAEQRPASPQFRGEVGSSSATLAGLLLEAGRAEEALSVVEEVLPAHERLVQAEPEDYELRRQGA